MEACQLDGKFIYSTVFFLLPLSSANDMQFDLSFIICIRAVIKDDDKSLVIKNVIPADEGIYICDAHNGVGQISAKAQLVVNCKCNFAYFLSLPFLF